MKYLLIFLVLGNLSVLALGDTRKYSRYETCSQILINYNKKNISHLKIINIFENVISNNKFSDILLDEEINNINNIICVQQDHFGANSSGSLRLSFNYYWFIPLIVLLGFV